jgi:hypothetical protein
MRIRLITILVIALLATPGGFGTDPAEAPASEEDERWQEELEDFVPSEEVPADSAISFPVDI